MFPYKHIPERKWQVLQESAVMTVKPGIEDRGHSGFTKEFGFQKIKKLVLFCFSIQCSCYRKY